MKRGMTAAVAALVLALTGCSAGGSPEDPAAAQGALPAAQEELLAEYGLEGMDAVEIIDHLDRLGGDERPADLLASVRPTELLLAQGEEELSLDMPEDRFYVSVAPYVDSTHDCFFHSLTTCQGELVGVDVDVTVVDDAGEVLVEEARTTFENGFVGLWLPRGVEGTIEVSYDGKTGEVPFSTVGDEDATCLTTLQLA